MFDLQVVVYSTFLLGYVFPWSLLSFTWNTSFFSSTWETDVLGACQKACCVIFSWPCVILGSVLLLLKNPGFKQKIVYYLNKVHVRACVVGAFLNILMWIHDTDSLQTQQCICMKWAMLINRHDLSWWFMLCFNKNIYWDIFCVFLVLFESVNSSGVRKYYNIYFIAVGSWISHI